jgi:hypothetical protein
MELPLSWKKDMIQWKRSEIANDMECFSDHGAIITNEGIVILTNCAMKEYPIRHIVQHVKAIFIQTNPEAVINNKVDIGR